MTKRTSFLTRCLALLMALVLTVTGTNMGVILQAAAADLGNANIASGKLGTLMVQEYSINDGLKALLESDYVAGNGDYSVSFPEDSQLTIDQENSKVTIPGAKDWNVAVTMYDINNQAIATIDPANPTYSYDGPFYVNAVYTHAPAATNADAQNALMNNINALKNAYDKAANFVDVMLEGRSAEGVNDNFAAKLGSLGQYLPEGSDVAAKFGQVMSDLTYLNTMYQQAAGQFGEEKDYVKSLLAVENENEMILEFAYDPFDGVDGEGNPKGLKYSLPALSAALKEYKAQVDELVAAGTATTEMQVAAAVLGDYINSIEAYNAKVQPLSKPSTYCAISAYMSDAGKADTAGLSKLLAGTWTAPSIKDISFTKTLTANTGVEDLIVDGALTYYDAEGNKHEGEEEGLVLRDEIKVAAGLSAEKKAEKVKATVESYKEQLTKTAKDKGIDEVTLGKHFTCSEVVNGNVWTVTYAPNKYGVTVDGATVEMDYGYHYELPSHSNSEKMYVYTVTGEGTANAGTIRQGGKVIVDTNLTITSEEQAAYYELQLMAKVAEHVKADANGTTILKALKDDKTIEYRKFNKDGLLTLVDGTLTAASRDGWTAVRYQIEEQVKQDLTVNWGQAVTIPVTISDNVEYVNVDYEWLIADAATVNTYVANANAVISEAAVEKDTLEKLLEKKDDLARLNKNTMVAANALAETNDEMPKKQKDAFAGILENCYDGNGQMKLYNLLVAYEDCEEQKSTEAPNGLAYFYTHAAEFLDAVTKLDSYLNALLTGDQRELKTMLGDDNYASLTGMQESVNKAAEYLKLSDHLKTSGVDMLKLGDALNQASELSNATTYLALGDAQASVTGEGIVELNVILNVDNEEKSFNKMLRKANDEHIIDAEKAAKIGEEIRTDANLSKYFTEEPYVSFYDNDFDDTKLIMTLDTDQTVEFHLAEKNYTVNGAGVKTDSITVNKNSITLEAPNAVGEYYLYTIGGTTKKADEFDDAVHEFSQEEIKTLFVDGAYTVEREHHDTLTFGYKLNIPMPGAAENKIVEAHYDYDVVKGNKATVTDEVVENLKSQIDSRLIGVQEEYYDQDGYNPVASDIFVDTIKEHNWTYKTYTVKVPGMANQQITLANRTVQLAPADNGTEWYEYQVTVDGETKIVDSRTLQEYKFDVPGNYEFTRIVHAASTGPYDNPNATLVKTIAGEFLKKSNENAYDILTSGAFTLDITDAFDKSIDWRNLSSSAAVRSGDNLNAYAWNANDIWAWKPVGYSLDGQFKEITEDELVNGIFQTSMKGALQAVVYYELAMADAETTAAKLLEANELYTKASAQLASLEGLKTQKNNLKTVAKMWPSLDVTNIKDVDKQKEAREVFDAMQKDCFDTDGNLILATYLTGYTDGVFNDAGEQIEDSGLSYFYKHAPEFIDAIVKLCDHLDELLELGTAIDIAADYDEGYISDQLKEMAPSILKHRDQVQMRSSVNMAQTLDGDGNFTEAALKREALGQVLEDILDSGDGDDDTRKEWTAVTVDTNSGLTLAGELTVNGDGGLYVNIAVILEDKSNEDNMPSVSFTKTAAGAYDLTADDLANLNAAIEKELKRMGYVAEYYDAVKGYAYVPITELTLSDVETTKTYKYNVKSVKITDPFGGEADVVKPKVENGLLYVDLLASTDDTYRYDYYIGTQKQNTKYTDEQIKMEVNAFYKMFGDGEFVINCVASDEVSYTVQINIPGYEESVKLTYEDWWKPYGTPFTVPTNTLTKLHSDINAELERIGYIEATDGKYYENKYTIDKLDKVIEEDKTLVIDYTYKQFPVNIEGAGTQYVTKADRTIDLPKHDKAPHLRYEYLINGEIYTDETYTFGDDLFEKLVAEGSYTITRKETDTVDYAKDGTDEPVLSYIATEILKDPDTTAYKILTNGALVSVGDIEYLPPILNQEKNVVTIANAIGNAYKNLVWEPYEYWIDNGEKKPVTEKPFDVTMVGEDNATYVNFRMTYMTMTEAQAVLKIADDLVADAKNKKATLDSLSSAEMAGYFDQLSKSTIKNQLLPALDTFEFSEDSEKSAVYREYYKSVFSAMAKDCFIEGIVEPEYKETHEGKLTLYYYLSKYSSAEKNGNGIAYFYENYAAIDAELTKLTGYLNQLVGKDDNAPEGCDEGLKYFLENVDIEGYDLSGVYNYIDKIQVKVNDANKTLDLSNHLNPNASAELTALGKVLAEALKGYTPVQYTVQSDLVVEAKDRMYTNVGRFKVTLKLSAEEYSLPQDAYVEHIFIADNEVENEDDTYRHTVTDDDIATLLKLVTDKRDSMDTHFGENKVLSNAGYYVDPCNEETLKALLSKDGNLITLTEDKAVELVWELKDYTVKVPGVDDEEDIEQTVNLKSLTIELPESTDPQYTYSYMIGEKEVFENKYTFAEEDLLSDLFDKDGVCEIQRVVYDARDEKLLLMVNKLNEAVGAGSFTLEGESGNRTGIHGNIAADDLMNVAMALTGINYDYVGLNDRVFYTEGLIHMQAMVDAMLSDAEFGSETIIAIGEEKPAQVLKAKMQLGAAADNLDYENLDFTVDVVSVPDSMQEEVSTIATALKDMREVFSFTGSGDPENPDLKVSLNMTTAKLGDKTVNLEKVYEAYLTAMLATYDLNKTSLDEINQRIAFQLLKDYTEVLADPNVTTTTLENTLAKLGQNVELSQYQNYFEYAQRFYNETEITDNGLFFDADVKIETLIDKSGVDVSEYKLVLSYIYEHTKGIPVNGSFTARLLNADDHYEAVILDPRAFDKDNISSAQNTFNYTNNLAADALNTAGESVIMLLDNVKGDVTLNNATVLDLNGYKIEGTVQANGTTIIIDSASGGYVGTVKGNAILLAGSYGNENVSAMLKPGYSFENGTVAVDIESMINNGYLSSVPYVAAEVATSFALNHYASAAFYACAGGHDVHTIYELNFDDFVGLIADGDGKKEILKGSAINVANAILDMFTMGTDNSNTENGLEALINEIAAMLIDVDHIVDLTKAENGGTLGTIQLATRPWKFSTEHVLDGDYLTAGLTVNSEAKLQTENIPINIPNIQNTKAKKILNELADIAVQKGSTDSRDAGMTGNSFEIDLKDITLADNTVTVGGGLKTTISLNFCGDDDGNTDYTDHGSYNRMLGVIVAYANNTLNEADEDNLIENGEIPELNDWMSETTVGQFFDAIENAVNSDKPFDYMVEKIGAKLTDQEIAKLSKLYEKFQAGAGKVLAKLEAKAPLDATPLSFLVDENGLLILNENNVSIEGTKNINYRGYGLNFNLSETSVRVELKFCTEDYKLIFKTNDSGAADTVKATDTVTIGETDYVLTQDAYYELTKEEADTLLSTIGTVGGNIIVTYADRETTTAGLTKDYYNNNALMSNNVQEMLTPTNMYVWHVVQDKTDSTGKTFVATEIEDLRNIVHYEGSSVYVSTSNEIGIRFGYTVQNGDAAESALAAMNYRIAQFDPVDTTDTKGNPVVVSSGDDFGMITVFNKYNKEATPEIDVYAQDRGSNVDPYRQPVSGNMYFGQLVNNTSAALLGEDQNIRFYIVLEAVDAEGNGTGEKFALYSDILQRDIRFVAEQNVYDGTNNHQGSDARNQMVNNLVKRAVAYENANG